MFFIVNILLVIAVEGQRNEKNVVELLETFSDVLGDFNDGKYRTQTVAFTFDYMLSKLKDIEDKNNNTNVAV
eukprot:Pgem_evm1s16324